MRLNLFVVGLSAQILFVGIIAVSVRCKKPQKSEQHIEETIKIIERGK